MCASAVVRGLPRADKVGSGGLCISTQLTGIHSHAEGLVCQALLAPCPWRPPPRVLELIVTWGLLSTCVPLTR